MHVLVNCFFMAQEKDGAAGAGKYLQAILPNLAKSAEVALLLSRANRKVYQTPGATSIVVESLDEPKTQRALARADVYFDPQNGLTPLNLPSKLPVAVEIYDLQHNHYPHFFGNGRFEQRNKTYGFAIARADSVVTISEWEKQNLSKYFGRADGYVVYLSGFLHDSLGKKESKVSHWAGPEGSDYYLYPAVTWPHKNHYRLLEAFRMLNERRMRQDQPPLRLVLTGTVDHVESNDLWRDKMAELREPGYLELLGYVSDAMLAAYMRQAKGVIFPSLYEGFGIPIVDAMRFGKPVLASRLAAIPEVTKETISFFRDPLDSYAMARDIEAFNVRIDDGSESTQPALEVAQGYSPDRTVRALLGCFEETIEKKRSGRSFPIVTQHNVSASVNPKRVTMIVDLDSFADKAEALERLLRNSLLPYLGPEEGPSPFEWIILCPNRSAETLSDIVKKLGIQGSSVAYYDHAVMRSKVNTMRFIGFNLLTTDYFVYHTLGSIAKLNHGFIKNAVAYLDNFADLFSCNPSRDPNTRVVVYHPDSSVASDISAMQASQGNPLQRFTGRVIRTSTCRAHSMIGTMESITKDVTTYSSITI